MAPRGKRKCAAETPKAKIGKLDLRQTASSAKVSEAKTKDDVPAKRKNASKVLSIDKRKKASNDKVQTSKSLNSPINDSQLNKTRKSIHNSNLKREKLNNDDKLSENIKSFPPSKRIKFEVGVDANIISTRGSNRTVRKTCIVQKEEEQKPKTLQVFYMNQDAESCSKLNNASLTRTSPEQTKVMQNASNKTRSKVLTKSKAENSTKVPKLTPSKEKSLVANVHNDSSSSEEEWEEVPDNELEQEQTLDDYKPEFPEGGVEITIEGGPNFNKRRDRKAFDMMECIRLHVNRVKKEHQLLVHQVHLLCLIAHGQHVNNILDSDNVKACALSLIPSDLCVVLKKDMDLNLDTIKHFVDWFTKTFKVVERIDPLSRYIRSKILRAFECQSASSASEYNLLFVGIARALGMKVRVCISLYPISFKAKNLLKKKKDDGTEITDDKKGTHPSKKNVSASTSSSSASTSSSSASTSSSSASTSSSSASTSKSSASTSKSSASTSKSSTSISRSSVSTSNSNTPISKSSDYTKRKKSSVNNTNCKQLKEETKASKSSNNFIMVHEKTTQRNRPKRSAKKAQYEMSSEESDSDDDFVPMKERNSSVNKLPSIRSKCPVKQKAKVATVCTKACPAKRNRKILSSDSDSSTIEKGIEHWIEIYSKAKEKWICIDCNNAIIDKPYGIESVARQPVSYVLAFQNKFYFKDVTKRYCSKWMTHTRKLRVEPDWWEDTLEPFLPPNDKANRTENSQLEIALLTKPLPKTISEFKNHPLYALKRHLLKFEAIYPPDAATIGFIRGEAVYSRDCVHKLHSRETWLKEARMVRIGEEPYKIVKARPKWDKRGGVIKTDLPLEVFGHWQTEKYMPPIAHNGKVPRNEYGNVELFKPCMLPVGTVHLRNSGLNRIAKKLNIDCSPAVVGFDGHCGSIHPVFDGFIVCEEFKDTLLAAWDEEQVNARKREEEKRLKCVYGNWKKLIKGLLIREKIKVKYLSKH